MSLHPMWVSGFVDGEGTFYVGINAQPTMTAGYQVLPEFRVVQHERDIQLMFALKRFFRAGVVRTNHDDRCELRIRKLEALEKIIIPFFETNPLQTKKKHDFLRFKKIIGMMEEKKHLTKEGLISIIDISSQMNRGDKYKVLEIRKKLTQGRSG